MCKYSILIPAYNAESYIEEAVNSILGQSFENFEIIILDDGSTDATYEVCKKIQNTDIRIKLFKQTNQGALISRIHLSQMAIGKYLIYIDADDTWEEHALITIEKYINSYRPDLLIFSYNLWNNLQNTKKRGEKSIDSPTLYKEEGLTEIWEKLLCTEEINSMCTKVISKSILQSSWDVSSISHGEDKLQLIQILEHCKSVLYIPEELYNYRIDNASITRTFNKYYFRDVLVVREIVWEMLKKKRLLTEKNIKQVGCTFLELYIGYLVALHKSELSETEKKELINEFTHTKIFVLIMKHMSSLQFSGWHKIMLFMVKHMYYRTIYFLYDLKDMIKRIRKNE